MEIWKHIPGYEGYYEASNLGRIRNSKLKIMKELPNDRGYMRVGLSIYGHEQTCRVHRLVALSFLENPENKPQINHKDGNTRNNTVENLEFCTGSENVKHAYDSGLKKERPIPGHAIRIGAFKNGILMHIFASLKEAGRKFGSFSHIGNCVSGRKKTAYGYEWKKV